MEIAVFYAEDYMRIQWEGNSVIYPQSIVKGKYAGVNTVERIY